MPITQYLQQIIKRQHLTFAEARALMGAMLSGQLNDSQIAAILVALATKGESVDEISATVSVLRDKMLSITVHDSQAVDIVGTGGDGANLFNISTAAAVVASAAGVTVAKHGNRAVSSCCGSADVLKALGVCIELTPSEVESVINEVGLGFMFAPTHHPALRYVMPIRQALKVRTLFNVLGPLCNPAQVVRQVIGVFDRTLLKPLAEVLLTLGAKHTLLLHSEEGLDEISGAGKTTIVELHHGQISEYDIQPTDFGFQPVVLAGLKVTDSKQSVQIIQRAFAGEHAAASCVIALNAGAAIYVSGQVGKLADGMSLAKEILQTGAPQQKLAELVAATQRYNKPSS